MISLSSVQETLYKFTSRLKKVTESELQIIQLKIRSDGIRDFDIFETNIEYDFDIIESTEEVIVEEVEEVEEVIVEDEKKANTILDRLIQDDME